MARRTAEQIRIDRTRAQREENTTTDQANRANRASEAADRPSAGSKRSLRSKLPGNPPTALVASEVITLIAVTAYDFLGPTGDGTGRLPDPRPVVATLVFWSLLGLIGSVSRTLATPVAWVGWILTSTVLVTGPRGKGIVLFLQKVASFAGVGGPAAQSAKTG